MALPGDAYQRGKRDEAAEQILLRIFNENPSDPEAVNALGAFYLRRRHGEHYIALLQDRHGQDRANFAISMALAETLFADNRGDEAARVVDAARTAAGDDSDLLYTISGLYARINRRPASEAALEQALKLDPAHAVAANDLGYLWADDGRKLDQAEARSAGRSRPSRRTPRFSTAWAGPYKRGRFAEAKQFLDQAIGSKDSPRQARADPTVLDHRGDVLYRLGDKAAAAADWQRAAEKIAAPDATPDGETRGAEERVIEKWRSSRREMPFRRRLSNTKEPCRSNSALSLRFPCRVGVLAHRRSHPVAGNGGRVRPPYMKLRS